MRTRKLYSPLFHRDTSCRSRTVRGASNEAGGGDEGGEPKESARGARLIRRRTDPAFRNEMEKV